MKPTADYVLLEPRPDRFGLWTPPTVGRDSVFRARVLATGPLADPDLRPDDEVLVRRPEGDPTTLDRLFVRADRVLARLDLPVYDDPLENDLGDIE